MTLDIIITEGRQANGEVAGRAVVDAVAEFSRRKAEGKSKKEFFVLGLPTGSSPLGVYEYIAEAENARALNMADVVCFNLDEYVGLPGGCDEERKFHKEAYWRFMRDNFYNKLDRQPHAAYIPPGFKFSTSEVDNALSSGVGYCLKGRDGKAVIIERNPFDSQSEIEKCVLKQARYELDLYKSLIENYGGVDIQLIGTGVNGHVGFHEAGIPFSIRQGDKTNDTDMLLVMLDESTRKKAADDGHFGSALEAPKYAFSMGVDLIFRAEKIILLADGRQKACAVVKALLLPVSDETPLSRVQLHQNVTAVLDYSAGQGIVKALGRYHVAYA